MSAISGIIVFMLIVIAIGRRSGRMTLVGYLAVAVVAIAQVTLLLYLMWTMDYPTL